MQINIQLDSILKSRKVTLYEFCKITDISYQQGQNIVKNRTKGISFSVIEKICLYLNCNVNDVLVLSAESKGYLSWLLKDFKESNNVKRLPQTKPNDTPRPFLQWVGGKREMIPYYSKFMPKKFKKYWEPFLGGGALYFHLKPDKAILNDSNKELVATFETIRDVPEKVIDLLYELRRKHSKDLYMAIRQVDRNLDIFKDLKNYELAARMIYLNQTCFNGLYRVNKLGQFNVPIGSSLNRVICDPEAIRNSSRYLKNTKIHSEDFEFILEKASRDDFVYFDPPYYPVSQYSDFTRYTKEKFYEKDQVRLKNIFKKLSDVGCKVMLSNSDCKFTRDLYSGFNINTVFSGRNLNSKTERRGVKVPELLVTNYKL